LYVYAVSILIGTVIQVLLPLPWLAGRDGSLRVAIDWRDPAIKQVFVLMIPVTLGLGLINFNAVIDTFFAARFIDRNIAPSAIDAALAAFSAGLTFNGVMLMLNRAFFSLQSPWTPTAVALANLVLNGILDAVFYRFGTWGIPLATSVVNIIGTAALLILLRRRL